MVARGNAGAHVQARAAIHLHAAGLDEFIALAARTDATGREEFVEADAVVGAHDGNAKGAKPGGLRAWERSWPEEGLTLLLGLRQADGSAAFLPFATGFEQLDALETLEDGTLAADGGAGLETVVLGHRVRWLKNRGARNLGATRSHGNPKKSLIF